MLAPEAVEGTTLYTQPFSGFGEEEVVGKALKEDTVPMYFKASAVCNKLVTRASKLEILVALVPMLVAFVSMLVFNACKVPV
jgi:hypothetical protein